MVSKSNGLNTNSTLRPISPGSTWKVLPCNETVAVPVTVRHRPQKASVRSSAVGIPGVRPRHRSSRPASDPSGTDRHGVGEAVVLGFNPGSQQPVEFEQPGPVMDTVGG